MRSIKALCALALVLVSIPMFGAGYIKFDGIDGESKAAGHEKWIELESIQFEGGSCNATARARATRLSVRADDLPAALLEACASRKQFARVVVDVDGRRHTLQNVSLGECPVTRRLVKSTRPVIRLDFASCADHPAAAGHVKVFDGVTGTLIGLTPTPVGVKILETTLREKTATMTLVRGTDQTVLRRAADPAAKVSKIEALTIKQTATQASVTFTNVLITGYVEGPQGPTLTFEFETMTGSPADYLKLGGK